MKNKTGQQEMVGFVLIVILVVVGLMVFLVISIRGSDEDVKTVEVENMLNALMKQTTDCAVVYEPDYDNFEDLFKSCHQGKQCSNLGKSSCDYLNESLRAVADGMFATEAAVDAYQIDFFVKDDEGQQGLLTVFNGDCSGIVTSAQRNIVSHSDSLIIRMKVCSSLS